MTAGTRPSTFAELFMPKLITVLREGYGVADFKADAVAGLTVAIVALPLSMAIAIASGIAPDRGLYTAIVGGFLVSALGGRDRPGRHRLPDLGRVLLRGGCRGRRRARPPQRTPQGLRPRRLGCSGARLDCAGDHPGLREQSSAAGSGGVHRRCAARHPANAPRTRCAPAVGSISVRPRRSHRGGTPGWRLKTASPWSGAVRRRQDGDAALASLLRDCRFGPGRQSSPA